MLKIGCEDIKVGNRVILPEAWHEKVMDFGNLKSCAYEFEVEEIVKHKANKETYYLCRPAKKEKSVKIAFSETAIKYLFGQEVQDQNIGLSFKDFLPFEDTHLLVTSVRNPNEVIPGIFKIETELVQPKEDAAEVICLNFKLDFTNGSADCFVMVIRNPLGSCCTAQIFPV